MATTPQPRIAPPPGRTPQAPGLSTADRAVLIAKAERALAAFDGPCGVELRIHRDEHGVLTIKAGGQEWSLR